VRLSEDFCGKQGSQIGKAKAFQEKENMMALTKAWAKE
jgi:hypothetical protein